MPGGSDGPSVSSTVSSDAPGLVPNQLAVLVPTFDPAKDDVLVYSQKVQLLIQAWPEGRWTELATRLILGCAGSAFMKLQIHQAEVTVNEKKSIEKIINILGGQWGQINLEKQYEYAEKAIYKCYQRNDESADSYLARADILWSELQAKGVTLEDLQPYVTLRGSQLSPEDKKKVLIDVDAANTGKLTIAKVSSAIRMLGASFFHDITGQRRNRGKTYDQGTLVMEDVEMDEHSHQVFATDTAESVNEDEAMDILVQEGDEDATLVADFEDSIQEVIQGDEELAATYTAYTDARKRLSDKFKSRGFWPSSASHKGGKTKGGFKSVKGKFGKGGHSNFSGRKSLQQRIMESRCRLCNRIGHWKAECPMRADAAGNANRPSGAPTSFTHAESIGEVDQLPLEFMQLPESFPPIDVPLSSQSAECFSLGHSQNRNSPSVRIRQYLLHLKNHHPTTSCAVRNEKQEKNPEARLVKSETDQTGSITATEPAVLCFASHGSLGVVDLGATKTVIGSNHVKELIDHLNPELRKSIYRCKCHITFRFGNHGTLKSDHAIVIPIHGFHLKVAIVQGSTPFLLSNTLLRALGAVIDTSKQELYATEIQQVIPLHLTEKGLFLLDLNDLASVKAGQTTEDRIAETHIATEPKEEELPPTPSGNNSIEIDTVGVPDKSVEPSTPDIYPDEVLTLKTSQHSEKQSFNKAIQEDQLCKTFARSLSLPHRSGKHVQFDEETSEGADPGRGESSRPVSLLDPGAREDDRRLWQEAPGVNVQGSMAAGPALDCVVRGPLSHLQEEQSCLVPPLCGTDGGKGRNDRAKGSSGHTTEPTSHNWTGSWETISQGQSQGQDRRARIKSTDSRPDDCRAFGRARGRRGFRDSGVLRDDPGSLLCGGVASGSPGDTDASHGECPLASHPPSGELEHQDGPQGVSDREADGQLFLAGDISSDCKALETIETCNERKKFLQLMHQYSQEFRACQANDVAIKQHNRSRVNTMFEVFCGTKSQLSQQCQQLGLNAVRFSRDRCDLQSSEGRISLFQEMLIQQPRHLWFSPTCGPWSGWSNINGSKSIDHWDRLHQDRMKHLEQIALGMVLLRYQVSQGRHFHWEQPRNSLMLRLPYLREAYQCLRNVEVDLCVAGDLRDPISGKPIRKSLTILSTSLILINQLQGLRCNGSHDHQIIEGTTKHKGEVMNRSTFTEHYPRKFARRIALCLRKNIIHHESSCSSPDVLPWKDIPILGTEAETDPATKRRRIASRARLKLSRVSETSNLDNPKRSRLIGKTQPVDSHSLWEKIFLDVFQDVPRVGKKVINDETLLSRMQQLLPGLHQQAVCAVASRGTSRTVAPPDHFTEGEIQSRICVFTDRISGKLLIESEWEDITHLSKRQLVRPSHPGYKNITVFARNTSAIQAVRQPVARSSEDDFAESPRSNPISLPAGEQAMTESQKADLENPKQPESFQALTSQEKQSLIRSHKNLGHPNPERFSSLLRQQGFRSEVARAALDYQCSICKSQAKPRLHYPATIREELDFNDRISLDGFKWTNKDGHTFHVYHIVDWATNFQVAQIAPSKSTDQLIESIINMWFTWAGAPGELVVDAGTEMNSEEFCQFIQSHNIRMTTISSEAPHQNGRAERHGGVLKHMLSKFEIDHPISSYRDLKLALWWCVQSKNACSLKRGYAPEVLVLGKHTRLPGATVSDEQLPAHLLHESETGHGIRFKQQLAMRESARKAFHSADNDAALRRAALRRSRPGNVQYHPGEWVMIWKQSNGALPNQWIGPLRIVVHENSQTIWTTMGSKLYRSAPEHVRPVTAFEAKGIQITKDTTPISIIAEQLRNIQNQGTTQAFPQGIDSHRPPQPVGPEVPEPEAPGNQPVPVDPSESNLGSQPDGEPEAPPSQHATSEGDPGEPVIPEESPEGGLAIPVPETDDDLICDCLLSIDTETNALEESVENLAWRCEVLIAQEDVDEWKNEEDPSDLIFVASAAKRQRSEVKLATLSTSEQKEFQKAKESEVQNWLKTGTVSRICRSLIPEEQILRCRWICTWKPLDPEEIKANQGTKHHKAKARLVILGYLDPKIEDIPRDSPTLGRHSKLLLLQLLASNGWTLRSFDIKAAFLQGKPQTDRVLGIEPVKELALSMQLKDHEVCKLEKGAYGLIDAPFQWYCAIREELVRLGFGISPFDPCVFVLRNSSTGYPDGIIGLHVDDGICGGNHRFLEKLDKLESKYPFGSKKISNFVFTGIHMTQSSDGGINMSQAEYIKKIDPIRISQIRRAQESEKVSEEERQALRALIGSLQYASVHTRPDLASRLSFLQSDINRATVATLVSANQALHEAKRHSDVSITIHPIPVCDLRFLAFSDASFASKKVPDSHTGCIIMSTHKDINKNVTCPVSPLSWGCKKIQRVVTSTLAAETVSLGSVLDQLSWMKLCWAWMLDPKIRWQSPSESLKQLPEAYSTATHRSQNLPESVAATDCKSLFDLVTRTAPPQCSEFRTQLTARSIKDMLAEGINLRWVHSGAQLADSLTKIMETSFLRETLRIGKYRLNDELAVLKSRSNARNRIRWLKSSCPDEAPSCICHDVCPFYQN